MKAMATDMARSLQVWRCTARWSPYRPPRPTVLAAAIDDLVRRLGLVVVISTGNYPLAQHSRAQQVINDYPVLMLEDELSGLLDLAPAALVLTVGALCTDHGQGAVPARENIDRQPLGMADHPSPATRTGPGPMHMIKPELCAPGGGFSYDRGASRLVELDPVVRVVGADGSRPDGLLATRVGTSFAAPLVSHAALRVLAAYPTLTSNGVRALLLASAEPTPPVIESDSEVVAWKQQARLTGYGKVSAERAEASDDHRAVLLAEEVMRVNDVHVFTVPLPSSFTERGGWRRQQTALRARCSPGTRTLVLRAVRRAAGSGRTARRGRGRTPVSDPRREGRPPYPHLPTREREDARPARHGTRSER